MAAGSTEREKGYFGGNAGPLPVQNRAREKLNKDQYESSTNSYTQCRS